MNSVCLLHTKSREIKLLTSNLTKTKGMAEAYRHINHITQRFANRGFTITQYHGDNAFKALEKHLGAANLHIVANEEHVPTIERSIRVVKERVRCITAELPFRRYPIVMTEFLVNNSVFGSIASQTRTKYHRTSAH